MHSQFQTRTGMKQLQQNKLTPKKLQGLLKTSLKKTEVAINTENKKKSVIKMLMSTQHQQPKTKVEL